MEEKFDGSVAGSSGTVAPVGSSGTTAGIGEYSTPTTTGTPTWVDMATWFKSHPMEYGDSKALLNKWKEKIETVRVPMGNIRCEFYIQDSAGVTEGKPNVMIGFIVYHQSTMTPIREILMRIHEMARSSRIEDVRDCAVQVTEKLFYDLIGCGIANLIKAVKVKDPKGEYVVADIDEIFETESYAL